MKLKLSVTQQSLLLGILEGYVFEYVDKSYPDDSKSDLRDILNQLGAGDDYVTNLGGEKHEQD